MIISLNERRIKMLKEPLSMKTLFVALTFIIIGRLKSRDAIDVLMILAFLIVVIWRVSGGEVLKDVLKLTLYYGSLTILEMFLEDDIRKLKMMKRKYLKSLKSKEED